MTNPCILLIFINVFILFPTTECMDEAKFRPMKADLVVAIDTAVGDAGRSPEMLDVEVIQHFLRKITMVFPLSAENARMAVVEFAASARVRLSLTEGIDQRAVDNVYDDVSDWYDDEGIDRGGRVNYSEMFRKVYTDIFTSEGDRPDAPNLLLVLTIVPSIDNEDATRWRMRARHVARGSVYNYSDPVGLVVTTEYASRRGTHMPKFTMTRGVGTFEPDAWYYREFNSVMHFAIIHLRHAVRSAWCSVFYTESQMRRFRIFDYTTCRADPAFVAKIPSTDAYGSFAADLVLAMEIDRGSPNSHHDALRTLVLNMTRHMPISTNFIRLSLVEFDRDGNCRLLANAHPHAGGCCLNTSSLFKTLVEKWIPQSYARFRVQESKNDTARINGVYASGNMINLRLLTHHLQKVMNQSGRMPQLIIVALVFPQSSSPWTLDEWYRRFLKLNGPHLKGGLDALIVTSGDGNTTPTYTMAVSPGVETLEMQTPSFGDVRGKLFNFIINITKNAVQRCRSCFYDDERRCVIDHRFKVHNTSGVEFVDGRFCWNSTTDFNWCPNVRICFNECDRRPWSEWSPCWPMGWQKRRRMAMNVSDIDPAFYRNCPGQKKPCKSVKIMTLITSMLVGMAAVIS